MVAPPSTRMSLIARLSDFEDRQAWDEFTAIYRPTLFDLARRSGLQDSDADDAVQDILWAVGRSVARWKPDPARARFRTWLARIARNLVINLLIQQQRRPWRLGDSNLQDLLKRVPDKGCEAEAQRFLLAFRRQAFAIAAEKVQCRVEPRTWAAFYRTSIDGVPVQQVSGELALDRGMVYVARSRVMRLLREEVEAMEQDVVSDDDAFDALIDEGSESL